MGTPQPPNKPGDACPLCFGPGTEFGDVDTPYWIEAYFNMLQPAEHWIEGDEQLLLQKHLLPQKGVECQWELTFGDYTINVNWNVMGTTIVFANNNTGRLVFMVESDDICQTDLYNDIERFAGFQAMFGMVHITWNQREVQ